jgi:WD40 repeat protein
LEAGVEVEEGVLVHERYSLLDQVGRGGFGVVYKALDTQALEIVAIKQINLHSLTPQEIIEATDAYNREIALLSDLSHPGLPRIHDRFTDPDHWYVVMDFIEGETLEQYLSRLGPRSLQPGDVVSLGLQLCDVLGYLHAREPAIIYRDLKPANIMLASNGHCMLIDFGIARCFKPGKPKDTIPLGSPGYAAPEQYGKAQTTPQADIYSLGALLHHLLSGRDPAETPFQFAPLRRFGAVEYETLEELIMSMVALEPRDRPADIGTVKETLQQIATFISDDEPHLWRPEPAPAPPPPSDDYWQVFSDHIAAVAREQQAAQPPKPTRRAIVVGGAILGATLLGSSILAVMRMTSGRSTGTKSATEMHDTSEISVNETPSPMNYMLNSLVAVYTGHTGFVRSVAWSPDGQSLAAASVDKTVSVWQPWRDVRAEHVYVYRGHVDIVTAVAWSPDGQYIASGCADNTVCVWSVAKGSPGRLITNFRGHKESVASLAWSPDGKRIVSSSQDGDVLVWDAASGAQVNVYQWTATARYGVNVVSWSPDGARIAVAGDQIMVWNAHTEQFLYKRVHKGGGVNAVAWSPDGRYLASCGNDTTLRLWDATTGRALASYVDPDNRAIQAISWSPDSRRIVSGSEDSAKWVLDLAAKRFLYGYPSTHPFTGTLAWSPDGKAIATGCDQTNVQVMKAPQ